MQEVSQLESQLIQQQQAAAAAQHHLSVFKSGPIDFIQVFVLLVMLIFYIASINEYCCLY